MTCSCNIVDLDVDRWTDIVFFQEKCFYVFTTLETNYSTSFQEVLMNSF